MKYVLGVIFLDFRKAFDAIPHSILLQKRLGVAGDLLCWIRDYLSGGTQVTINGCQSQTMPVSFGVPQGSVLGPTLFSLSCNDNPQLHMYAVDTTVYLLAPTFHHTKSFTQKSNLIKTLYFLPRQARTDFYFGVILL